MQTIHLDYTLQTPQERSAFVQNIIDTAPPSQLTNQYLEILSDYILSASMTKQAKKDRHITTSNRQVTIRRRETSYEELVSKFENGEDGVHNLINPDKNLYLTPKLEITAADIAEVPGLAELRRQIAEIEERAKAATGKTKYLLKKQAIEMRQQQYILKQLWRQPLRASTAIHTCGNAIEISDEVYFDQNGEPTSDAVVTFFKPEHISAILCNYELLHEGLKHKYNSDFHYLMRDFDKLMAATLGPYPEYLDLVRAKVEGKTNLEIKKMLEIKYNMRHTPEYVTYLWRNKIPKLLSDKAKEDYLIWYYTYVERGDWKRCTCCGEVKLAHPHFFSKNPAGKSGFYSICKICRRNQAKIKK